jgi:hypothetical protein
MDLSVNCYKIQFVHKDSVFVDSLIIPVYQTRGFQIIENGVYDLIIDGDKYFQSLVLSIDSSGFWISKNWDFKGYNQVIKDSVFFSTDHELEVRIVSIDKGVGGLPFSVGNKKYNIKIIQSKEYCRSKNAFIKIGKEITLGHYYFTAYGWKIIRMKKGKPYLRETSGEYLLRRK